jgi:hypothetical protein
MNTELVPVEGVPCPCPGTPHAEGDTVSLYPRLGLHAGVIAQRKIIAALERKADDDEVVATLMEVFCRGGVAEWTVIDEEGKAVPVTPDSIELYLIGNYAAGRMVAEKADSLYSGALIDPLLKQVEVLSPPTPTNGLTLVKTGSSRTRRKR